MYMKTVLSNAGNVEFTGVRELNISPTSLAAGYHSSYKPLIYNYIYID